jgi:hypothetical protein
MKRYNSIFEESILDDQVVTLMLSNLEDKIELLTPFSRKVATAKSYARVLKDKKIHQKELLTLIMQKAKGFSGTLSQKSRNDNMKAIAKAISEILKNEQI